MILLAFNNFAIFCAANHVSTICWYQPSLCWKLKGSISNEFLMASPSEGLDSVGFLSVTHMHMHAYTRTCVYKILDSSQNKVVAFVFHEMEEWGQASIYAKAQQVFHLQQVGKVQCRFLYSGSGPFFAPKNLSLISLFVRQVSGRGWLQENGCA